MNASRVHQADCTPATQLVPVSGSALVAEALRRCGIRRLLGITGTPVDDVFIQSERLGIALLGFRGQHGATLAAAAGNYVAGGLENALLFSAGPAATNAITGALVARDNGWPLLILAGRRAVTDEGMGYFQELDTASVFRPVTKAAITIRRAADVITSMIEAYTIAVSGRPGPVFVDLPEDVLVGVAVPEGPSAPIRETPPDATTDALSVVTAWLTASERPLLVLGEEIRWHANVDALRTFVEQQALPFITSPLGRGFLPDAHPLCANAIRRTLQAEADLTLMVGPNFDWRFRYGADVAPGSRVIQVDFPSVTLGRNVPEAFTIPADSGRFLNQLAATPIPAVSRPAWQTRIASMLSRQTASHAVWMQAPTHAISFQQLFGTLREFLNAETTVILDGSFTLNCGQRILQAQAPATWFDPGWNGIIGAGIAFGLGAKLARPASPVVVVCGDTGFTHGAMEFETAVRNGIAIVVLVANNDGINGKLRERRMFPSGVAHPFATFQPGLCYEETVRPLGAFTAHVRHIEDLRPALERAFAAGIPACINVDVDPCAADPGPW